MLSKTLQNISLKSCLGVRERERMPPLKHFSYKTTEGPFVPAYGDTDSGCSWSVSSDTGIRFKAYTDVLNLR